jgi:hypothetical protein
VYFFSRNNYFYSVLARTRSIYRYCFTGCFLSALVCVWLYGVYFRVDALIDAYQNEIMTLQTHALQQNALTTECTRINGEIVCITREIEPFTAKNDSSDLPQSRLLFMLDQAKKAGLTLNSCAPVRDIKHDWYTQHGHMFQFSGTFKQAHIFLRQLRAAETLIQCDQLQLESTASNFFTISCTLYSISVT